ncbi:hypothetical protein V8E36_003629 [Tilletia maclaganii]
MLSKNFFLLGVALLAGQSLALDSTQQGHADTIAQVAKNYGTSAPTHACVTAVATAITESALYIYANSKVSASLNYPHDKVGSDHDSVGLFQQRVSIYKNIAADMDAAGSTRQFLAEMVKISGWQNIAPGQLAQKVQRSAYPTRYQGNVPQAQSICGGSGGSTGGGGGGTGTGGGGTGTGGGHGGGTGGGTGGSQPGSGEGSQYGSEPYAYGSGGSGTYGYGSQYGGGYDGTGSQYGYNGGDGGGQYGYGSYGYGGGDGGGGSYYGGGGDGGGGSYGGGDGGGGDYGGGDYGGGDYGGGDGGGYGYKRSAVLRVGRELI